MTLFELGAVAFHLHYLADGDELLPVEAALLQAEPSTESDQQVSLLHDDIGRALAPGVGPSHKHWVCFGDAVDAVPGAHQGDSGLRKLVEERCCGLARDAPAYEQDGSL